MYDKPKDYIRYEFKHYLRDSYDKCDGLVGEENLNHFFESLSSEAFRDTSFYSTQHKCRPKELDNPKAREIVKHCYDQLIKANRTIEIDAPLDQRWSLLKELIDACRDVLSQKPDMTDPVLNTALLYFYLLGVQSERLGWPAEQDLRRQKNLITSNFSRQKPLKEKTRIQRELKAQAQQLAEKFWDSDNNDTRLGDMCELVKAEMMKNKHVQECEYFPEQATGLKKWLRPVAPDYAKKPGRRKKK